MLLKFIVKGLENTQAKLEYINILYDNLANIGGRMFYVTVMVRKKNLYVVYTNIIKFFTHILGRKKGSKSINRSKIWLSSSCKFENENG